MLTILKATSRGSYFMLRFTIRDVLWVMVVVGGAVAGCLSWKYHRLPPGIGYQESIIVLILVFILFGHRLPSVIRSLGHGMVEFKYRERDSDRHPHWLTAIDPLMIGVVLVALAALLMRR